MVFTSSFPSVSISHSSTIFEAVELTLKIIFNEFTKVLNHIYFQLQHFSDNPLPMETLWTKLFVIRPSTNLLFIVTYSERLISDHLAINFIVEIVRPAHKMVVPRGCKAVQTCLFVYKTVLCCFLRRTRCLTVFHRVFEMILRRLLDPVSPDNGSVEDIPLGPCFMWRSEKPNKAGRAWRKSGLDIHL